MLALSDLLTVARLREGTYQAGGHTVYFQDADTLRDAADLYAVLREDAENGSPNLENDLVRAWVAQLQSGQLLDDVQLAKLFELMDTYAPQIAAYRASGDRTQDILNVPENPSPRILT
jgi:hypothetical protein